MKRLLIYLIGNIGAGKTTLLQSTQSVIAKAKTPVGVLSIDDYRHQHNPHGTKQGEDAAWKALRSDLLTHPICFVECTGVSTAYRRLRQDQELANHYEQIVVWLDTSPDQCLRRCQRRIEKGYLMPPLPWDFDLTNSIQHVQAQLLQNTDYHAKLYGNKAANLVLIEFVKLFLKPNQL